MINKKRVKVRSSNLPSAGSEPAGSEGSGPSSTTAWNNSIFNFFNVNILAVNHEYIFDPYALFVQPDSDCSGYTPATVTSLIHNYQIPVTDFVSIHYASLIFFDSNFNEAEKKFSEYYTKEHERLSERYKLIMNTLTYVGEQIEDYNADDMDYHHWELSQVAPFKHHHNEKPMIDCQTRHLYSFIYSLDTGHFERIFELFLSFVIEDQYFYSGEMSSELEILERGEKFCLQIAPDMYIQRSQGPYLLFIEVKETMDEITQDGNLTSKSSDNDTANHLSPGDTTEDSDQEKVQNKSTNCYQETDGTYLFQDMNESYHQKYRKLTVRERSLITKSLVQLFGKLLYLFEHGEDVFTHTMQTSLYKNKVIRYGISVIGHKVMFIAVCFVDEESKEKPTLTNVIFEDRKKTSKRYRTDIFVTRQFSLLKNKDRKYIADILFALNRQEANLLRFFISKRQTIV